LAFEDFSVSKSLSCSEGGRGEVKFVIMMQAPLGHCQTRNKVEQLSRSTLLRDKVACLTLQVTRLLTSRATNLPDRNHLCSRQLCRAQQSWARKLLNFVACL